jgi:hypothetical protein
MYRYPQVVTGTGTHFPTMWKVKIIDLLPNGLPWETLKHPSGQARPVLWRKNDVIPWKTPPPSALSQWMSP